MKPLYRSKNENDIGRLLNVLSLDEYIGQPTTAKQSKQRKKKILVNNE